MTKEETAGKIYLALCRGNVRKALNFFEEGLKGLCAVLKILREAPEGVTAGYIAERLQFSTARVAAALNTLEQRGHVRREREKSDGRKVIVKITPEGLRELKTRETQIVDFIADKMQNLTEAEAETLLALTYKITE